MDVRPQTSTEENVVTSTENVVNSTLLLRGQAVQPSTRPAEPSTSHGIRWLDGTVDNEFMNRKKSNCCCIYEKPRRWDESSSSSSSSSSGDEEKNDQNGQPQFKSRCRGHGKRCYQQRGNNPPTGHSIPSNTNDSAAPIRQPTPPMPENNPDENSQLSESDKIDN